MSTQTKPIQIGPATFDGRRWIAYKGVPHRLPARCIPIFKLLASNLNTPVRKRVLEAARIGKTPLKHLTYEIGKFFRDFGLGEVITIEGGTSDSYWLEVNDELVELSLPTANAAISSRGSSKPPHSESGFRISLDSMIVNNVWELLSNDGPLDGIIRRCYRTYRRCLEDFAFAIVYSSKIATGMHFRQGHNEGNDKRVEFLQQLGDVWTHQELDEEVRSGALLKDEQSRRQIKRDLEGLSRCIDDEAWPFREWMNYDGYRHLGQDRSLLENNLLPDEYLYNVMSSPFYRDAPLEKSFGESATGMLAEFLRSGIPVRGDLYAEEALRNYVRLSALTNVTVMREYDVSCNDQGIYRLPHVVRCSILRETTYDSRTQQQRVLRDLIVQHALNTAFRSISSLHRRSLVTVLLNLRNEKPFINMRSILEHDHLVLFQPGNGKERAAEKLIREIWRCAEEEPDLKEHVDLDRYRILKELGGSLQPRLYDKELHSVFPELNPVVPSANS